MDLEKIKQDLIEHLGSVDKTKLSLFELKLYAETVKIADDMAKPDAVSEWMKALEKFSGGYNTAKPDLSLLGDIDGCCCSLKREG